MKRSDKLNKSVERIRGYCLKLVSCEHCRYDDAEIGCIFQHGIPADWEIPERNKKQEADTD